MSQVVQTSFNSGSSLSWRLWIRTKWHT